MDALSIPPPRLITFDTYGTLIDWDTPLRAHIEALLRAKQVDLDAHEFHRTWYYDHALPALAGPFMRYRELLQTTLKQALGAVGVNVHQEDGAGLAAAMASAEPFPDAVDVLRALRDRFALATISNSEHDIISHAVTKLGNPFTYVLTGEDVRAYKPDPALFERVLSDAGVPPAESLHVAQSQYVDLPRSVSMGIPTIWVNRQGQVLNPEVPEPMSEISDLRPLPSLLGIAQ